MNQRLQFNPVYILLALLSIAGLSGCATDRTVGGSPYVQQVESTELPAPGSIDLSYGDNYQISPFDELDIAVFGVEELTVQDALVDAGGSITFPLVGELQTLGKSTGELSREIEGKLRGEYIKDPHVTVNLKKSDYRVVTVDGQVAKPGQYPVRGKMSLMRAVALAGGTGEFAELDDVVVFRSVENNRYVALYNLGAIRRGHYVDPDIYPNDVIVVGDSKSRRIFKDILQASPLLTTPLIILFQ